MNVHLRAAGQMEAEAGLIDGLVKGVDAMIKSLRLDGAWQGPDATRFGQLWGREIDRLVRIRGELLACADSLRQQGHM